MFTTLVEPGGGTSVVYSYGFFYGGLAQFVAGVLEYNRKNTFAFVAFCSYGAFWMSIAINGTLKNVYTGDLTHTVYTAGVKSDEMMLSVWGILTFLLWLCTFSMNFAISSLFFTLSLLFWFLAAGNTNATLQKFAGGWGILVSAIAFYIGTAQLMEDVYGRPILPLFPFKPVNKLSAGTIGTKKHIEVTESV